MNAQHALLLHWWYVSFLVIFGVITVGPGRNGLNARSAWAGLRVAAGDGSSDDERIEGAVKRRQAAEGAPTPIGLYVGSVSFALAVLAAFTSVPFLFLYAVLCLSMSLFAALAFWRLRNSQPTRAAVLAVRKSESVIPVYWFVALVLSALLVPAFAGSQYELAGTFVGISTLVITYVAWRMTLLPAMLAGVDIPAEQLVDGRLRFNRSTMCVFYAVAQTFVFWSQIGSVNLGQTVAGTMSIVMLIGFLVWTFAWRYRPVRLA